MTEDEKERERLKEDYRRRYGVEPLSDEEFEKVKKRAEATRKARLGDLYKGTNEEYELALEKRKVFEEQFARYDPREKPFPGQPYVRVRIPFDKIKSFFGFKK